MMVDGGWKTMYVVKKTRVTTEYRDMVEPFTTGGLKFSSALMLGGRQPRVAMEQNKTQQAKQAKHTYPAIFAADKFVLSIRLMQYKIPTVKTRRRSMRP